MNINKISKIFIAVIAVISVIFLARIFFAGDDAIKESADLQNSLVGPFITVSIIILVIALALALIFSIKNIASDGAKLKKTAISVVAFVVVILIGFGLAKDYYIDINGAEVQTEGAKMVGAGLYALYFIGTGAIIAMLLGGVKKMIK
ncbi:MAG: hypothetical protein HRT68_01465 [Flavobacteriaceae bacterium]|nr:hypothetical protein [Flavobacteriaceae bacterium]